MILSKDNHCLHHRYTNTRKCMQHTLTTRPALSMVADTNTHTHTHTHYTHTQTLITRPVISMVAVSNTHIHNNKTRTKHGHC